MMGNKFFVAFEKMQETVSASDCFGGSTLLCLMIKRQGFTSLTKNTNREKRILPLLKILQQQRKYRGDHGVSSTP